MTEHRAIRDMRVRCQKKRAYRGPVPWWCRSNTDGATCRAEDCAEWRLLRKVEEE